MLVLCVLTPRLSFVSRLNCIRYQSLTLIIYHVVVNIITIVGYTLVKVANSHYLLLFFVCILYIVFVCLFKLLFVFLIFCYHLW